MNKYARRCFIVLLFVTLAVIFSVVLFPLFLEEPENSNETKLLIDTYPTDVIVYGIDIEFDKTVPSRKIDNLKVDEVYDNCTDFFYRVLIINDMEDKLVLEEEDWKLIDQCIDKGCNLFYLGTQYLELISTRYNCMMELNDTDMFIGIAHEADSTTIGVYGVWDTDTYQKYGTENLAETLEDVILSEIRDYVRQL